MTQAASPYSLKGKVQDALKLLIDDDLLFIKSFMKIPSKHADSQLLPFDPWPVQRRVIDEMSGRDLVVKDSQIGSTSIWSAVFMKRTMTRPNTTSVIMAHEEFLTSRLLHRADVFYESVPKKLKPEMDHRSTTEKRFPDINSVLYIGTAKAQVKGRGEPIHNLLFSEEAFYPPDAYNRIIVPSIERVPDDGLVVRESTPNGEQGSFYEEVSKARAGKSIYRLHAMYWWENPDNHIGVGTPHYDRMDEDERDMQHLRPEELLMQANLRLTLDQLRWRRFKLLDTGKLFMQEHLESLDTCFLSVGEPYYDPNVTMRGTESCYPAPGSGPGGAEVWHKPEPGGVYTLGVDPGQGKITESVGHVWRWDLDHPRHEASIRGLIEPRPMAEKCMELGFWYNQALMVPEDNSHGIAFIQRIVDPVLGAYPRVYFRTDIVSGRQSRAIGWHTGGKTKPFMMQEMKRRLLNLECHEAEFWRQLRGWKDGYPVPVSLTADDVHDAACLAHVGAIGLGGNNVKGYRGNTGWTW